MIKIKNRSKNIINPAKQRKARLSAQRWKIFAKIMLIVAFLGIVELLYVNATKITDKLYAITAQWGFVINEVTVEGQQYSNSQKIARALKIKRGVAIFSVSLPDLKSRLEDVEWIKYAMIERKLPDMIHVSIVERTPIALGQKNKKLYIIDDEGMIINEKDLKPHLHLPIIIGDGAEIYANSLINMLKIEPELFKHISAIIRVSERRWNIRFDNGLEVRMPEENPEKSWQIVIKLYKKKELFESDITALDLRIANKIFVEKK